jgi:16S rRNA (guanine(966)-N(2))-methyltransferase RsmD
VRIIAGAYRSRQLKATPPHGIRPTSDKLRETLFNILGETVRGCTFLDGCAGVGAIGIEAISRGAENVIFADQSRKAVRMIRENLQSLNIDDGFKILELDLIKALDVCARDALVFDVAFIDPPYDRRDIYDDTLRKFDASPLLSSDAVLIFEHSKRAELPETSGSLRRVRTLVQGDSALAFYRRAERASPIGRSIKEEEAH